MQRNCQKQIHNPFEQSTRHFAVTAIQQDDSSSTNPSRTSKLISRSIFKLESIFASSSTDIHTLTTIQVQFERQKIVSYTWENQSKRKKSHLGNIEKTMACALNYNKNRRNWFKFGSHTTNNPS